MTSTRTITRGDADAWMRERPARSSFWDGVYVGFWSDVRLWFNVWSLRTRSADHGYLAPVPPAPGPGLEALYEGLTRAINKQTWRSAVPG